MLKRIILYMLLGYLFAFAQGAICFAQEHIFKGQTPQDDPAYALGVSGHIAQTLPTQDPKEITILLAGGCNFPDVPATDGGVKQYYDHIYITSFNIDTLQRATTTISLDWKLIGRLPTPLAYAAHVVHNRSVIVVGGKSPERDLNTVYRISITPQGLSQIDTLPSLKYPRSGMAFAKSGSRLYLIGGMVDGVLSNSVVSLDLENPQEGWREEPSYPDLPQIKVLASASQDGRLFLVSSFAYAQESDEVLSNLKAYEYNPSLRGWRELRLPKAKRRDGASFGGGMAFATDTSVVFTGGVRRRTFATALHRERQLKHARQQGDTATIKHLEREQRTYLTHPAQWYRFNGRRLTYNTRTNSWDCPKQQHTQDMRADAVTLHLNKYNCTITVGGELKPGIRTPDITFQLHNTSNQ